MALSTVRRAAFVTLDLQPLICSFMDDGQRDAGNAKLLHPPLDKIVQRMPHFRPRPGNHTGLGIALRPDAVWQETQYRQKNHGEDRPGLTGTIRAAYSFALTPDGALMSVFGEKRGR